ncbi:MAG TPA: UPF0158 family protein [Bacillota bacterium]|nr:UPF0158 family protein [Bacillota bacterium]
MRQVSVTTAWLVNAFENSSEYSEYYLDMLTGDVKFFSPMDFPEHVEIMKRLDRQTDRFIRLPKLEKELSRKIKQEFTKTVDDTYLKGLLENAMTADLKFRNALMEYRDARMRWYAFQNEKYAEFLKEWFKKRGIELVEKPAADNAGCNKKPDQ